MSTGVSEREPRSPTELLSRYIAQAEYGHLPTIVTERAKLHILDCVGCVIGGTQLSPSRMVIDFFAEMGGRRDATVLGTRVRLPVAHAGYANSYLSNALDFDDTYVRRGHPASAVIPAALAVAEAIGASGQDLLHAVVLGYEVCLRIGGAIVPTPERYKRVWGLATWQVFGAITAVSKLLRLDAERIRHAFGLGALNAPVPNAHKLGLNAERPFGWAKNNYGWASMGAILGCLMAQRGFQGNRYILDGEQGFWIMAGSDRCDFEGISAGLGEEYLLPNTGFKPYACCRWTQTALDAAGRLRRRDGYRSDRIARVDVHGFGQLVDSFWGSRPSSIFDAQYNLPYVLALELLGHSPRSGLSEAHLGDPQVLALLDRIRPHLDPEADRRFFSQAVLPVRVVVTLEDGTELQEHADVPTGAPGGPPFTPQDLETKFGALVEPILGPSRTRDLASAILHLEERSATELVAGTVPVA